MHPRFERRFRLTLLRDVLREPYERDGLACVVAFLTDERVYEPHFTVGSEDTVLDRTRDAVGPHLSDELLDAFAVIRMGDGGEDARDVVVEIAGVDAKDPEHLRRPFHLARGAVHPPATHVRELLRVLEEHRLPRHDPLVLAKNLRRPLAFRLGLEVLGDVDDRNVGRRLASGIRPACRLEPRCENVTFVPSQPQFARMCLATRHRDHLGPEAMETVAVIALDIPAEEGPQQRSAGHAEH